ncbi:MAG: hypothetical protein GXO02_04755 [Epsilonproteobacteria bacterium]|nr:hypothetical protein [Campylobacterota bacterium]
MKDHNLDDLILSEPEPKKSKSKGILAILALVIILLVIGVILAKLFITSSPELKNVEESIKKEPPAATMTQVKEQNGNTPPIEPIPNMSDEEPIQAPPASLEEAQKADQKTQEEAKNNKEEDEDIIIQKESPKENVTKEQNIIPKAEKKAKKVTKTHTKTETKPKRRVKKETKTAPKRAINAPKRGYYIQVGSFSKYPSSSLLFLASS